MPKIIESGNEMPLTQTDSLTALSRRRFLRCGTAATIMAVGISACHKDHRSSNNIGNNNDEIDLGSGDLGLLNYAYALEQLEAAFYVKVITSPYPGMSTSETTLLTDIRDHELAHRELLKSILGNDAIPTLTTDFSSIDFSNRTSVLNAAKTFEDLGVSAYNGAGMFMTNGDPLTLAAKIVSVEARHAAYIRDLISNGSFADNTAVDVMGLDKANKPDTVISTVNGFLKTKIGGKNLPLS